MKKQIEIDARPLPSRRLLLLALSVLVPLILLSAILLSASSVEAEPLAFMVSGTVINPDTSPITDSAWVCLHHLHWEGWFDWDICQDSDVNGYFSFMETVPGELVPGDFVVQAYAPWSSPYSPTVPLLFPITSTDYMTDLGDLRLTYASFAGQVYEPDNVTLADEGWISVFDEYWNEVAGGDYYSGTYAVGGMPTGDFWLVAHPPADSLFWHSEPEPVTVTEGSQYTSTATQLYDLTLQDPNLVAEVVYPDGFPVTWIMSGTDEVIGWATGEAASVDGSIYEERDTASWGEFGMRVPSGDYHVWAYPNGTLVQTYTRSIPRLVPVPAGTVVFPTDPLTLTYPSFSGQVLDPAGNPLPPMECLDVWLETLDGDWVASDWYCGGQPGPYRLGGILDGDYRLNTGGLPHLGFFPASPVDVHVAPGSQYTVHPPLDLNLTPPQLEVFVEDPRDGQLTRAHVALWDDWGRKEWADSASDGPAMFGGLEPGDYWILAWPDESDIPALANSSRQLVAIKPAAGLISHTLVLHFPNVTGIVETPEGDPLPQAYDWDGNPVPHPAMVSVHNQDWANWFEIEAVTNITGEFSLALPHGDYELLAYPMHDLIFRYTKSRPVFFTAGNTPRDLGPVFLTYPRIQGIVRDPQGNLVSTDVYLWSDTDYEDWDDTWWYGPQDRKPFRFGGMPPGHYYVQAAPPRENPEGYGSSDIYEFDVLATDPLTLTENIALHLEMANVVGHVRFPPDPGCPDPRGCPVPWVEVSLHTLDWMVDERAWTNEAGQFVFSGLEPGVQYFLDVFLWGELAMEWDPPFPPKPVSILTYTDQLTPTLLLQQAVRPKRAYGEVVDEGGNPVDDALVFAYHEHSGRWVDTPTDVPSGTYELFLEGGLWWMGVEPLFPGVDWYFDPDRPDGGVQGVWFSPTLDLEEKHVVFTVTRFTEGNFLTVTGVVTTPTGAPIVWDTVWVDLCSDDGQCFGIPVDPDGSFLIRALPGIYEVWVWVDPATGFLPPLGNGSTFHLDEPTDLPTLYLRAPGDRTGHVSGRVIIALSGQGLAGVEIEAWTDEGDWNWTETITDGNYVMNLFPGHWHAGPVLTPEQEEQYVLLPPQVRNGHVEAGETITGVNFFLRRRDATIRGVVMDKGKTRVLTDTAAVVFAEFCWPNPFDPTGPEWCRIIADDEAREGRFVLKVPGGLTYTVGVWPLDEGYIPGPPEEAAPKVGGVVTGVQVSLIEATAMIYGCLEEPGGTCVGGIDAAIFAIDPDEHWSEDWIWPDKDPSAYRLWVTGNNTWTLDFHVDPDSGYIVSPTYQPEEIWVASTNAAIERNLPVVPLDETITGTVWVWVGGVLTRAPHVWVFAEGSIPETAGLYFETQTDENGDFELDVMSGEYEVGAHPIPQLVNQFPPLREPWASEADNPVDLAFRRRPPGALICGSLEISATNAPTGNLEIAVFGWSDDGDNAEVTGTLNSDYCMPVITGTTWHVWAFYEDTANNDLYISQREDVSSVPATNVDLVLEMAPFDLPDPICESVDPSRFARISLPAYGNLPEPLVEIQAGTFPVTDTVEVCATPLLAVPDAHRLIGFAYEMEARDSQGNLINEEFDKQVRFIFYLDPAIIGQADPQALEVSYYSTTRQEWIALQSLYTSWDDPYWFVTGKIDHFTRMGVMSPPAEPTTPTENDIYLPLVLRNFGS